MNARVAYNGMHTNTRALRESVQTLRLNNLNSGKS